MKPKFDFKDVFIFDLANNHQGDIDHALRIIREIANVVRSNDVRGIFKFQYRRLDTFIHVDHRESTENKHLKRFLDTRLELAEFQVLLNEVRAQGLLAMCTPFDEGSVDDIVQMGFDLIKVASCSAKDWPLLEQISETDLPVVFSTGGLSISNIDELVSFFEHKGKDFAIMHCVSIYPTSPEDCNLNQIDVLAKRYPNRVIGWSTHEPPDYLAPIQIATAKGAMMFERHVGLPTEQHQLNSYSSTPEQVDRWLSSWRTAKILCGSEQRGRSEIEQESLNSLRRGVFARRNLIKGELLKQEDVYFAMPYAEGCLDSGGWCEGIVITTDLEIHSAIKQTDLNIPSVPDYQLLKSAIHEVKAMLNEAKIVLDATFEVEYSHHHGVANFREFGAVIINCINREYCKKLIVQLPGQHHPVHYHKLKEETFQVLSGNLQVTLDGKTRWLTPGETCLVMPGVWHSFSTDSGCIFEEVSTTHFNNDSVYQNVEINKLERMQRKTKVDHWGRFQLTAASIGKISA